MATKVFTNLPLMNLEKSKKFFEALGYEHNPQFSNEKAACMKISNAIHAMLLKEDYFQTFTKKEIASMLLLCFVLMSIECFSQSNIPYGSNTF